MSTSSSSSVEEECNDNKPRIMTFMPTYEQFKDFSAYIDYMESRGAHLAGLVKIIPPREWIPRTDGYAINKININIKSPISQHIKGRCGAYQLLHIVRKSLTIKQFKVLTDSGQHQTPKHYDYDTLAEIYWKNITSISPLYGADVKGTLCDTDLNVWNINRLNTILDLVNTDYGVEIDGVNNSYLYFGMWKSTFAWHTEDMDLYSINYLHFGAPKTWYAIPPAYGKAFEQLANRTFPQQYKNCNAFFRHKTTLISPEILEQNNIPFNRITQEAGEIMITFPYAYHCGFNHGFNCAEATNFATKRWIEYGKRVNHCYCRSDMVRISMDTFVKRFQPEHYEKWLKSIDYGCHPEDPNNIGAASPATIDTIKPKRKLSYRYDETCSQLGTHDNRIHPRRRRKLSLDQNVDTRAKLYSKVPKFILN